MEAAQNFEANKRKDNVDLRANARNARNFIDEELAKAKLKRSERKAGLDTKRADAAKEWEKKQQQEKDLRSNLEKKSANAEYEYVYVDEDGNYYEGDEQEEEEEADEEEEAEDVAVKPNPAAVKSAPLSRGYAKSFGDTAPFTLRRNELADFVAEIQNKTSCLFRNVSHLTRLRDDHQVKRMEFMEILLIHLCVIILSPYIHPFFQFWQMNLKQQRESLKERRKEKRDKKSQEVLDELVLVEGNRVLLSRMTATELHEQKEYQKNLTKVWRKYMHCPNW